MPALNEPQKKAQAARDADKKTSVEVTIAVDDHKHAGQKLKKGAKIKVTESQKAWMIEQKIIKS